MSEFLSIAENDFEQSVIKSKQPVLVEFGAPWCVPCRSLEPELLKLAESWNGKTQLARVNVDECANLASRFQVMGLPTLILFVNGQPVQRSSGYLPQKRIQERFESYLS
jgi:thioredoxin 1